MRSLKCRLPSLARAGGNASKVAANKAANRVVLSCMGCSRNLRVEITFLGRPCDESTAAPTVFYNSKYAGGSH